MKFALAVIFGLAGAAALGLARDAWRYNQKNTWRPLAAVGGICLAIAAWLGLH